MAAKKKVSFPKSRPLPKEAWAFWANLNGPWWTTPQRVRRHGQLKGLWHKDGNADVDRMGLDDSMPHYLTFADEDKKKVEQFIQGFLQAQRLMYNFVKVGVPKKQ